MTDRRRSILLVKVERPWQLCNPRCKTEIFFRFGTQTRGYNERNGCTTIVCINASSNFANSLLSVYLFIFLPSLFFFSSLLILVDHDATSAGSSILEQRREFTREPWRAKTTASVQPTGNRFARGYILTITSRRRVKTILTPSTQRSWRRGMGIRIQFPSQEITGPVPQFSTVWSHGKISYSCKNTFAECGR